MLDASHPADGSPAYVSDNLQVPSIAVTSSNTQAESVNYSPDYSVQTDAHNVRGAPLVALRSNTWVRESNGLFDYESNDLLDETHHLRHACSVLRKGLEVVIQAPLHEQPQISAEVEPLARIVMRNGKLCVDSMRTTGLVGVRKGPKLWRVVKNVAGGYILREGDNIKLGRFKLIVRQIALGQNAPLEAATNSACIPHRICRALPEALSTDRTCRICLAEGGSRSDPLICPCDCRGTIECVHLNCLRLWIHGRLDLGGTGTYFYRIPTCELCKSLYATHMYSSGRDPMRIVELPKTRPPFIVLERDTSRLDSISTHVLSLADKKIVKLGRGHESDVRFADVSISRCHADIRFDDSIGNMGGFVFSDHKSKFGSLVAMRTPVTICDRPILFQAGRSLLEFTMTQDTGVLQKNHIQENRPDGDTHSGDAMSHE